MQLAGIGNGAIMKKLLWFLLLAAGGLWVGNTSAFSSFPPAERPRLLAHRGAHQTFDKTGLDGQSCTADRIGTPHHDFLENTIRSMQASFEAGADIVELDVHLTPDKQFAVFHDGKLECRTDRKGITEQTPMAVLKTLDIGYGYTFDGGKTFPFRGKGVGQMPTLTEVLDTFPKGRFLINFKSDRREEGEALAALLKTNPAYRKQVAAVYGDDIPTDAALAGIEGMTGFTNRSARACLLEYLAMGWTGYVPEICRDRLVTVPSNLAFLLWGWPQRFYGRMQAHGTEIVLMGDYHPGNAGVSGIDRPEDRRRIPPGFPGYVWTNEILSWR